MEAIQDVEETDGVVQSGSAEHSLLRNITNMMSDRVVTNTCIEKLFSDDKGKQINGYKCAIHPLDTFSKDVDKAVSDYEKNENMSDPAGSRLFRNWQDSFTMTMHGQDS
jgi:hypothetical protein